MTVSPAPVTSNTSRACGRHLHVAGGVEQRHALFGARQQQGLEAELVAQRAAPLGCSSASLVQAPITCASSARFGVIDGGAGVAA